MTPVPDFVALIPARMSSTRLPGKPLADIAGEPMVVRVARRALDSGARLVAVATDSTEVIDAVRAHGIQALLTRADHPSGTDRLAEAADLLGLRDDDIVVNVQGDEPFIHPELLDGLITRWKETKCPLVTAVSKIHTTERLLAPSVVKVVRAENGEAIYFSRSPIPHLRGVDPSEWVKRRDYWVHIGVYGYDRATLAGYAQLKPTELEAVESLEQLRFLAHGLTFQTVVTDYHPIAIDTLEDLEAARMMM
jgi:3-deoxy-manno-octulosonate cytidylyltransferase (CMP-KDO synthetase)